MSLSLTLLGEFTARADSGATLSLPTRKTWALLGYLAVNADRPQSRERLMALLWSDRDERQARQSLNHALLSVRKLGRSEGVPLLDSTGEQVTLRGDGLDIDILRFRALLETQPVAAAALYHGPFLGDLSVPDPAFGEWLSATRAEFHDLACGALERAIDAAAEDAGVDAIEAARQLVRLDPVRESGHQRLMRLLYERGDRASALRQYRDCTAILEKDLGVEPGAMTRALYEAIRCDDSNQTAGEPPTPASATPPTTAHPAPLREPDRKGPFRTPVAVAVSIAIAIGVGIAVFHRDIGWTSKNAGKPPAGIAVGSGETHRPEATFDAEWRQTLALELKNAVTSARQKVLETAGMQAADIVKRAQAAAKKQAATIVERARQDARNQAAEIVAQATADARAQAAELVKQTQQVARAQAARILARAEDGARKKAETAAREFARKTKELARLERKHRLRIAQAAPIPGSKPASANSPANAPIATAKPTSRHVSKINFGTDRQAIERAITDHYFVSNNWGEIHEISSIRIHEIRGDQVEMTVEYVVTSMSTAGWRGFAKRSLQGRFLLNKEGGSFVVLKMWDTKENDLRASSERKPESRAPAISTARKQDAERAPVVTMPSSGSTIDFATDRAAIELAISDYYFLSGHLDEDAEYANDNYYGAEILDFRSVAVQKIDRNEVEVLAEFLTAADSNYGAVSLKRKSRFLLRKINESFSVIRMWRAGAV